MLRRMLGFPPSVVLTPARVAEARLRGPAWRDRDHSAFALNRCASLMSDSGKRSRRQARGRRRVTLLHWRDTLDQAGTRVRLYAAVAIALYLVSWTLVIGRAVARDTAIDFAVGDAMGLYVYLPSLVIDRDLSFDNQLAIQHEEDQRQIDSINRNRWPIGVALSVAPAFLVAHGASLLIHYVTGAAFFVPNGYSPLYFACCVGWIMALGLAGMICIDRLIVERFNVPGRVAAAAVLTTWLGTNYLWYTVREPLLAHMVGATWVIFCVFLIHLLERNAGEGRLLWWHVPALALAVSMAVACRFTNAFIFPLVIYAAVVLVRAGLMRRVLRVAPLVVLALAPLLLQVIVMRSVLGRIGHNGVQDLGYEPRERFYWTEPALFRSLFSSRHGLFFSTPALLVAAAGLIWYLVRRRGWRDPLLASFVLSAMVLWYVNSAWYAWWFGPSVGNRGFVELAGLFTIGFALAYAELGAAARPRWRSALVAFLALSFLVNYAIMSLKMFDLVRESQTLIPWEDRVFTGRWERI